MFLAKSLEAMVLNGLHVLDTILLHRPATLVLLSQDGALQLSIANSVASLKIVTSLKIAFDVQVVNSCETTIPKRINNVQFDKVLTRLQLFAASPRALFNDFFPSKHFEPIAIRPALVSVEDKFLYPMMTSELRTAALQLVKSLEVLWVECKEIGKSNVDDGPFHQEKLTRPIGVNHDGSGWEPVELTDTVPISHELGDFYSAASMALVR